MPGSEPPHNALKLPLAVFGVALFLVLIQEPLSGPHINLAARAVR
jgi:hypothetical protein